MQSHWINLFFVCSRSCSSKKRYRSKTHHSSHRVVLTTERKSTLLQGTFQRHRLPYTAITKKSIQIQKWMWCTLTPSRALQEDLSGCNRRWQECALPEGFHTRRARCRRSHYGRKSKHGPLIEP